eukprot:TRINITY_DN88980_c0_g1_i1.p1 TRINITY_DN88980_c0_g1~~TRINITY_DN88980_c0_g1_i1.p1  ORF type:complete len:550 (+),score=129.68 TRINITY_DN88980_c0_g1_i1:469-2118(+)
MQFIFCNSQQQSVVQSMELAESNIKQQLQTAPKLMMRIVKGEDALEKVKEHEPIPQNKIEEEICKNKLKDIIRMKDELQKKLMSLKENEELIQHEFNSPLKLTKDNDYYALNKEERKYLKEELKRRQQEAYEFVRNLRKEEQERQRRIKERERKELEKRMKLEEELENAKKEKQEQERAARREEAIRNIELLKQRKEQEAKERTEEKHISESGYLYRKFEEQYKKSILLPLLEDKKQKLAEKRNLYKPITKEEIETHVQKVELAQMKHEEERKHELERNRQLEGQVQEMLKKFQTKISQIILQQDTRKREEQNKRLLERKSVEEKRKLYANSLKETCPIIPSENKAAELKQMIEKLKHPVKEKRDVRKQYAVSELYGRRSSSRPAHSADENGVEGDNKTGTEDNTKNNEKKKQFKRYTPKHAVSKPKVEDNIKAEMQRKIEMEKAKKADYLTELRLKREEKYKLSRPDRYNWSSDIFSKKLSPAEKRERVERKAKMIEEKAKQNEKLFYLKGGVDKNVEMGEYVTDMFLDAIKAKLSILENIQRIHKIQ